MELVVKGGWLFVFRGESGLSWCTHWMVGVNLTGDAGAIVNSTAGIGQGRYQTALLAGDASRSHFGQGDMVREARGFGTSPAHVQILVKLIAVNICPELGLVQVIHALHVVGFRRG